MPYMWTSKSTLLHCCDIGLMHRVDDDYHLPLRMPSKVMYRKTGPKSFGATPRHEDCCCRGNNSSIRVTSDGVRTRPVGGGVGTPEETAIIVIAHSHCNTCTTVCPRRASANARTVPRRNTHTPRMQAYRTNRRPRCSRGGKTIWEDPSRRRGVRPRGT